MKKKTIVDKVLVRKMKYLRSKGWSEQEIANELKCTRGKVNYWINK